jgi:hypothetical protein
MKSVTNRYNAGGKLFGLIDRKAHRLIAGQLAKGIASIEHNRALTFRNDGGSRLFRHRPALQPLDIHVGKHHAV